MADVNHSQRLHARLSASGSSRWINCTPSIVFEEQHGVENKSSIFADEGTLAHEIAQTMFEFRVGIINHDSYYSRMQSFRANELWYDGMEDEVLEYVNYVFSISEKSEYCELFSEERVSYTEYVENGFGTTDNAIVIHHDSDMSISELHIIDLKFGKGIPVSAVDNSQLKLYAYGVYSKYSLQYNIQNIVLHIGQPRLKNYSSWELTPDELILWLENTVKPAAEKALIGEGEFKTGDHCKFCRAKHKCRAMQNQYLEMAKLEFADPNALSEDEVFEMLSKSSAMKSWLSSIEEYALNQALKGLAVKGYKLVNGRSNRKWSDEQKVESILLDSGLEPSEVLKQEVKSVAQIETLIGKAKFKTSKLAELVVKSTPAPTLVPVSDNRPAIELKNSAKEDFA